MPLLPGGVVCRLGILRPKPAGIKTGLVLLARFSPRLEPASLFLPVLQQHCPVEHAASLLAKYDPLRIVGKAAPQIAYSANRTLFHDQAVFDSKSCLFQTDIVIRITVKAGKKIGVAVFLQDSEAFMCKTFVIDAMVSSKQRVPSACVLVLIGNAIGRICQD